MKPNSSIFKPGQLVFHKLFQYRGVILKADETFQLTDEWYEMMAKTKPPKDKLWYHILVHNHTHMTYVAERNLEPDSEGEGIDHPMVPLYFTDLKDGIYKRTVNWEGDNPVPVETIGFA